MKSRSVLIIVENLPVPFDRRVWQEATTLARNGYRVSVICPKGKGFEKSFEVVQDVAIYRHSLPIEATTTLGYLLEYGVALFWEMLLAIRIASTRGFDAIHACNPPDLIFLVGACFKLGGKKFLFDHHDLAPEVYVSKFGRKGWKYRFLRRLEWLTFKTADVVISTNDSYRQIAIERGDIAPERIFVVRSGPDISRLPEYNFNDPSWRNGRKYLVAYLGVMGAQEGLDLLIEAISHIVTTVGHQDIQFLLLGDGPERGNIQELAGHKQIAEYITFTGRVSDSDLWSALASADVCVNPDRYSELNDKSTMNKIVEYMAMGKPIVQFELTEGRKSAGDASLYAKVDDIGDFSDKVLALLADPQLRSEMGHCGRKRVENTLGWSHQEGPLLAAYDALFGYSAVAKN
jgi:glycosyltransferase involved in cell wall biosynthesis